MRRGSEEVAVAAVVASDVGGGSRWGGQRKGRDPERVRERRGVAWRRGRRPGRRGGSQAGKEELAWLACAPGTQLLRGEGRKTTEGLQWWAGPILLGHQVGGPQVSVG